MNNENKNTLPSAKDIKNKVDAYVPIHIQWRIASVFLSLVTTATVPILLFIAYMNVHNFFSYDFFIEGLFGMKIFLISTLLLLMVGAVAIWGSPLIFLLRKKNNIASKILNNENKLLFYILSIMSLLLWFVIIFIIYNIFSAKVFDALKLTNMIFMLVMMLFLAIHIGAFFFSAKHQFFSSIVLLTLLLFSVLNMPEQVSQQVTLGLKVFGVGGDLPITIKIINPKTEIHGKVKLITPKNIYFSPEGMEHITATYPISNVDYYEIDNSKKN